MNIRSILGLSLSLLWFSTGLPWHAQGDSPKVPSVGDSWEMPGFECTVVAVGPEPFSYTSHGKTTFLSHVEDRWVNHMEMRPTDYTIVVDPGVPSVTIEGEEAIKPKDPKGGHYYLIECDRAG